MLLIVMSAPPTVFTNHHHRLFCHRRCCHCLFCRHHHHHEHLFRHALSFLHAPSTALAGNFSTFVSCYFLLKNVLHTHSRLTTHINTFPTLILQSVTMGRDS